MNSTTKETQLHRRGASLIELLVVIGVLIGLFWLLSVVLTGSGGAPSVKERAERQIQKINMYSVYQGFFSYGTQNNGKYPSSKTDGRIEDDTTSEVFEIMLDGGYLAAQHLISPNEYIEGFTVGYPGNFSSQNTSFALPDYDEDDWLRYPHWGTEQDSQWVLLSDRWFNGPDYGFPDYVHNLQSENDDPGFWNLLMNDGGSSSIETTQLSNGDDIFNYDSQYGDRDVLMVHD